MGKTFAEVDQHLPDDATYLVQDVSPIFDVDPSYNGDQFGSSQWTVVAACADEKWLETSTTIEIAVAPTASVSAAELASARAGDYSDSLVCDF
ncbi:hypothetical protein [Microbacterium sp. NPDC089695]|uniref:hypothetical protein n=1 Tax=Microbacterium sp. NPDC089695 TaxID=3364198 RepID=UPI0037F26EC2